MAKRKSKRQPEPPPELPFFDLPLHPEAESGNEADSELAGDAPDDGAEVAGRVPASPAAGPDDPPSEEAPTERQRTLFGDEAEVGDGEVPGEEAVAVWPHRLRAGLADLTIHVLMLAVAAIAALRLGVDLDASHWPPFAGLALIFSFLYWMVPVAFWGQTPGMAWVGHAARSLDDEPLTFRQTFLRWLGALLTAALAGLPQLLSLKGGASLSDRMSASKTVVLRSI